MLACVVESDELYEWSNRELVHILWNWDLPFWYNKENKVRAIRNYQDWYEHFYDTELEIDGLDE